MSAPRELFEQFERDVLPQLASADGSVDPEAAAEALARFAASRATALRGARVPTAAGTVAGASPAGAVQWGVRDAALSPPRPGAQEADPLASLRLDALSPAQRRSLDVLSFSGSRRGSNSLPADSLAGSPALMSPIDRSRRTSMSFPDGLSDPASRWSGVISPARGPRTPWWEQTECVEVDSPHGSPTSWLQDTGSLPPPSAGDPPTPGVHNGLAPGRRDSLVTDSASATPAAAGAMPDDRDEEVARRSPLARPTLSRGHSLLRAANRREAPGVVPDDFVAWAEGRSGTRRGGPPTPATGPQHQDPTAETTSPTRRNLPPRRQSQSPGHAGTMSAEMILGVNVRPPVALVTSPPSFGQPAPGEGSGNPPLDPQTSFQLSDGAAEASALLMQSTDAELALRNSGRRNSLGTPGRGGDAEEQRSPFTPGAVKAPAQNFLEPGTRRASGGSDSEVPSAPSTLSLGSGPGGGSTDVSGVFHAVGSPANLEDSLRSTALRGMHRSHGSHFGLDDEDDDAGGPRSAQQTGRPADSLTGPAAGLVPILGTPPAAASVAHAEDIALSPVLRSSTTASLAPIPCSTRPAPTGAFPYPPYFPAARHAPITATMPAAGAEFGLERQATLEEVAVAGLSQILLDHYTDIEKRNPLASAVNIDATLRFRATNKTTGERVTIFRRRVRLGDERSEAHIAASESLALAEAYGHVAAAAVESGLHGASEADAFATSGLFLLLDAFVDGDAARRATYLYTVFEEHPRHWLPRRPHLSSASTPTPGDAAAAESAGPEATARQDDDGECNGDCLRMDLAPATRGGSGGVGAPALVKLCEFCQLLLGGCAAHSPTALQPDALALVMRWLLLSIGNALLTLHRNRLRHGNVRTDVYVVGPSAGGVAQACEQLRDGDEEAILALQVKLGPPALRCTTAAPTIDKATTDLQDTATVILGAVGAGLGLRLDAPLAAQEAAIAAALGSPHSKILRLLMSIATEPLDHTAVSVAATADCAVGELDPASGPAALQATLLQQLKVASPVIPILGIDQTGTVCYASTSAETLMGTALVTSDRPPLHLEAILRTGIPHTRHDWVSELVRAFNGGTPVDVGRSGRLVALPPLEPAPAFAESSRFAPKVINVQTASGAVKRVQAEVCVLPALVAASTKHDLKVPIHALVFLRDCSLSYGTAVFHALNMRGRAIGLFIPQPRCALAPGDDDQIVDMTQAARRLFGLPMRSRAAAAVDVSLRRLFPNRPTALPATVAASGSTRGGTVLAPASFTALCSTVDQRLLFPCHVTAIERHVYFAPTPCETNDFFSYLTTPSVAGAALWRWLRSIECVPEPDAARVELVRAALLQASTLAIINAYGVVVNVLQVPRTTEAISSAHASLGSHDDLTQGPAPSGAAGALGAQLLVPGMLLWQYLNRDTAKRARAVIETTKQVGDMYADLAATHAMFGDVRRHGSLVPGHVAHSFVSPPNDASTSTVTGYETGSTTYGFSTTQSYTLEASPPPARRGASAATLPPGSALPSPPQPGPGSAKTRNALDFGAAATSSDTSTEAAPANRLEGAAETDDVDSLNESTDTMNAAAATLAGAPSHGDMLELDADAQPRAPAAIGGEVALYFEPRISMTEHNFAVAVLTKASALRAVQLLLGSDA